MDVDDGGRWNIVEQLVMLHNKTLRESLYTYFGQLRLHQENTDSIGLFLWYLEFSLMSINISIYIFWTIKASSGEYR